MIDSLGQYIAIRNQQNIMPAAQSASQSKVDQEFLTIFYKELLKQVVKAPDLILGEGDEEKKNENDFFSSFNSDMMVEQYAKELARSQAAQLGWLDSK